MSGGDRALGQCVDLAKLALSAPSSAPRAAAAHPTAVSSAAGDASTSSAICLARLGPPAFIANVADSASRVVCAAGVDTLPSRRPAGTPWRAPARLSIQN